MPRRSRRLRPFGEDHFAACHFPLQTPTGPPDGDLVATGSGGTATAGGPSA